MNLQSSSVAGNLENVREDPAPRKELTVCTNPATCAVIAEYPVHTVQDVITAVKNARQAQPAWQALPVKKRTEYVMKFAEYIQQNSDKIARIISEDNGKTLFDALFAEVGPATLATAYYCKNAAKFLADRKLKAGNIMLMNKRSRIVRVPYGVVGIISPWNYPFAIPFSEVVMGLLAGNTVILKAASETQVVGHILKDCIEYAGLPENVFTYINMPGSKAGDAFIDAGVDKLFFTGSVPVGKYLMKKASERLTPLVLELGGNDAMIVCDDADLYRAACGAVWAGMQNAGQSCGGVERIYVHKKVYHEFLAILKDRVEGLRVGEGKHQASDIGPMTTRKQMMTVQEHIDDALAKGAKIFAQSKVPQNSKGNFMPCTVLTDVNHSMLAMNDETFGPIVGVMPFETINGAIELANDSHLGLTCSVWSKNRKKAKQVGRRVMAGAISINDHLMTHGLAETPWGGFKQSGIGRTHGDIGFAEMTQPQVIVDDIMSTMPFIRRNFWWQPFEKIQYEGMKGLIDIFHGKGFWERFAGLNKLTLAFFKSFAKE
ncbi:MAG: succinate-semialdehyde dehydrogenase [Deltaproteobacteria bacterium HGW-Deltaproteobacteria-13]|jgi:succinate-semialdehyde dehydrogenase/glutarate-semialdehyde dehydrogenase|nr:MAG: succinate-semialdehyde dehydrogenase [Deltaproteobacteria bacterium HGW-Deltaproteobacteria-13]